MAHELIPELLEEINSLSPSTSGFGADGGTAQAEYTIERDFLPTALTKILGYCLIANDGRLNRGVPLSHPDFPWLYASKITSIQGMGADGYAAGNEFVFPGFAPIYKLLPERIGMYKHYKLTVQFEPRPYKVIQDAQVHQFSKPAAYFDADKNGFIFTDWCEHLRYTTVDFEPYTQWLTTQMAGFYMHCPDFPGTEKYQQTAPTNGGGPKMLVCKQNLTVTWFMVPFRMTTSNLIRMARGKINYEPSPAKGFLKQEPGSLLLKGVKYRPNPGPYPPIAEAIATEDQVTDSLWDNRYVDIMFEFEEFTIPQDQRGPYPTGMVNQANGVVLDNHNRLPTMSLMKWVYASNGKNPATTLPIYNSMNMKALFTYEAP